MADLFTLQSDFADFVRGDEPTTLLCDTIVPMGLPPAARLAVHRNNHRLSLIAVLAGMYPVTQMLVGEEFFSAVARQFIAAHPPQSPALIDYGHDFPDFLAAHDGLAELPWIADVARIEAARSAVYHEADEAPLDPARLQALAPLTIAEFVFRPKAALRLIRSNWPVHLVWDAHQAHTQIRLEDIDLSSGPITLLIHRQDFQIHHTLLGEPAANLFTHLTGGMALGRAVEAAEDDGTALGHLLSLGVFADGDLS